ncbi:hypothetical protein [Nitratidesulfovibrio sp. 1201_IL3209]|uniref:hypothetical protein n=1 Tax=Nitratidesulfovibrio sp. 1201_IL3209 TaxID=3084053 RepID=UPI002FD9DD84
MLTPSDMYWLTRLDGIVGIGVFLGILGFAVCAGCLGIGLCEGIQRAVRAGFIAGTVAVLGALLAVFVPTTKEAVAIYVIPAIANNESVRAIPDTAARLADEWLKQKLGEITGEKTQKK